MGVGPAKPGEDDPANGRLSDAQRLDWLRLIRSENVGPVVFRQLLERYGSPAAALEALPELARRAGAKRKIRICSAAEAERELAAAAKAGVQLLASCETDYPALLAALDDAPPVLCLRGRIEALRHPTVGIVVARNASANGRRFAGRLAVDLAEAGFAVASGLARGIDTAAHLGTLPHPTLAVLAGGVDVVYPPENEALYGDIREHGAALSEIPLGVVPQARHFPRRNRLISGLSLGVVVVEPPGIKAAAAVEPTLRRMAVSLLLAPESSPLPDALHPRPGERIRAGPLEVKVTEVVPRLKVSVAPFA